MIRTFAAVLLFVFLVFPTGPAHADFYKWVDENGVVHFSDTLPKSKQEVETINTPDYPAQSTSYDAEEPETYAEPALDKPAGKKVYSKKNKKKVSVNKVEIYTTSW